MSTKNQKKKQKSKSPLAPLEAGRRVKRNEPCPCGSGKKAKRCCLPRIKMWEAIPKHLRAQIMASTLLSKPVVELDASLPVDPQPELAIAGQLTVEDGEMKPDENA